MREVHDGGAPLSRLIRNNLPKSLTSFVGREAEIEELRERVFTGGLLTLTGGGGSGKTRLALEVARAASDGFANEVSGRFRDGVWLVELDALVEESLVALEVASVLGVGERRSGDMVRDLPEILRGRRALILLDNCEHLAGACAMLCEALLKRCSRLAILATSREPLGVPGEWVHPVPPLLIPESPGTTESVAEVESVRLFAERASAVWPGFELTGESAGAVVEICTILDGIPLAIELAASRMNMMTPAEIAVRLDDALGFLTSGPRTAPHRQSTLRATVDWSYDLLPDAERAAFCALSVFSGGFTLEAAEKVCCVDGAASVLDLIHSLVSKSLLQVQRTKEASRYRFQEVIRQYASEKLEKSGEAESLRGRHATYFRDFVEKVEPELDGPNRYLWLDLLDKELDNVRAALSWAAESGEGEVGLRICNVLPWYWLRRGRLVEGRALVERALEVGAKSRLDMVRAIHVSGVLTWMQGDREAAGSRLAEAVERFRELDGVASLAQGSFDAWPSSAFSVYSLELLARGEMGKAVDLAVEGVAIARRFEESTELAFSLGALGVARMAAGDFENAKEPLEESAALCRRLGDGWLLSFPLGNLAVMDFHAGDYEGAQSLIEESIRALRGLVDIWLLSNSLAYLAVILAARDRARLAVTIFGATEAMRDAVGQEEVYAHYRADYEWGVETAQNALGEEAFAAAWAKGRAMDAEEAISFALEEGDHPEELTPALAVFTLGGFRVEVNGGALDASAWRYARVRELFVYLVCNAPVKREKIGLDLWPDANSRQLRDALGNAMYRIRKALNGALDPFSHKDGKYHFDRTVPYALDVEKFEEKSLRARKEEDAGVRIQLLEEAAALYRGDFLEGESGGEWIFYRQQELRETHTKNQILLGDLLAQNNDHENARNAYKRATAHDPYSTASHLGIIRSFIRQDETGRALEHYRSLGKTFREDLGAQPPQEIVALIKRLRNGEEI